jgi:mannose-6-phosphate isomerase-like protein (cupin superfamily)
MTGSATVVSGGQAEKRALRHGRGVMELLVGAHNGAIQIDMHVNVILPRTDPGPRHYHTTSENAYYVLAGTGLIVLGDASFRVTPGDAVFVPPGVPHSASNIGDEELRLLEIYSPVDTDFVEV